MELRNLEIIDNTNEGLGVAKSEEGIVFVKGGLVGDIVDVEITQKKKKFSNGFVKKYLKYKKCRHCPKDNIFYNNPNYGGSKNSPKYSYGIIANHKNKSAICTHRKNKKFLIYCRTH
mgnify:CR=1 FL=1